MLSDRSDISTGSTASIDPAAENIAKLTKAFREAFVGADTSGLRFFFAPGRVNLMGDHIDYCGGMVLPAAIKQGTYFAAQTNPQTRKSGMVRIHSANFNERREFSLDDIKYAKQDGWLNYPKGVFNEYRKLSLNVPGMDVLCLGDLPIGSSLSSSASLSVGTAMIALSLSDDEKTAALSEPSEIAFLCQRAESGFNGVQCGIMDQATIVMGREGKALFLNCANLKCEYVTPLTDDCVFLIIDSGKTRSLEGSKYNERKSQADAALEILRRERPQLDNLCRLRAEELPSALECISDDARRQSHNQSGKQWDSEILKQRTRHIVLENARVSAAKEALETGDSLRVGEILTESHLSLDKDYEVSGEALNFLVYESLKHSGVLGARMTGAGFSGCIVSLVQKDALKNYCERITGTYKDKTGLQATCFVAEFSAGARELNNER